MIEPGISKGPGSLGVNRMTYEFDYFSGSQIGIYIGDLLVDDVESIQFNVSQTKRPVYGYASQYFHKVADGQVLVEGTFSIPFKEADYILATLSRYVETSTPISIPDDDPTRLRLFAPGQQEIIDYQVKRENIERRLSNAAKKDLPDWQTYGDLAALSDEKFEDIAEVFEDVLWKNPEADLQTGNLISGRPNDYIRRADQYPLFDIYILYGDVQNAATNHTIKKLIDVSIIGQGQAIVVGGEPIREQYRFFARNLG